MKKLSTLILGVGFLFLVSCGTSDLKYHDEIMAAHEKLMKAYEQVDKTMNEATGKPEKKEMAVKQVDDFKKRIEGLVDSVKMLDKVDDDAFKNAFVSYAQELKKLADTEYQELMGIVSLAEAQMTDEKAKREQKLIEDIQQKLDQMDDQLMKAQQDFAQKHNIQLQ